MIYFSDTRFATDLKRDLLQGTFLRWAKTSLILLISIFFIQQCVNVFVKSSGRDSNSRPLMSEATALPAEPLNLELQAT